MSETNAGILTDAIARNAAAVVSLPSAGMLRHHKTRFLAEVLDGFWIESPRDERVLIDELIQKAEPAGISFRGGVHRVAFASPILRRDPRYAINAITTVEAALLAFPADIKAVQRRNFYRVRVTPDTELRVRAWRVAERAQINDRPPASQEIAIEVRNISAGGTGLLLKPRADELKHLGAGDRLRLQIIYRDSELLIEGRIRHTPKGRDGATPFPVGVQFAKLEANLEGRQTLAILTRIIGEMQREEVRRTRLGLVS